MRGLLSFLIFGALFFFMMRFGCGAHAGHGGHGDHDGHAGSSRPGSSPGGPGQQPLASSVDPVCGMKVEADMGYSKMFRGAAYRFCSRDCLDKFESEPDRYVGASPSAAGKGR